MYQVVDTLVERGWPPWRIHWLRLDHPLLVELDLGSLVRAILDGVEATEARPLVLCLDELAYADRWDLWLKTFHDERWPVKIIGSSSASSVLRERGRESGVGRWDEHLMHPLLLGEYLTLRESDVVTPDSTTSSLGRLLDDVVTGHSLIPVASEWRQLMLVGGYPELALLRGEDEASDVLTAQRVLRRDAVERAIYKDIPQSFGVDNPLVLERLVYVLAAQVGGLLSPTNIASDLGVSRPTVDKYTDYLERSFLTFTTQAYAGSEVATQRRGRKVFFHDTAIRNAALQRGLAPLSNPSELGHLTENLVGAHLKALADLTNVRLFHYRSGRRAEVDFVLGHPTEPVAFEIGLDGTHSRSGLRALLDAHPELTGRAYLVAPNVPDRAATTRTGIGSMSVSTLLMAISSCVETAVGSPARRQPQLEIGLDPDR